MSPERLPTRLSRVDTNAVFLNIPYDLKFQPLYLAYIVGLAHLGLKPRATLGIPGGERRMDRILDLIKTCRYSIHDLSRVEIDPVPPRTPRFNMPCELGMTIAWQCLYADRHTWFVFEAKHRRIQKSLSDLDGTDEHVHAGSVSGVMRELCNAFVRVNDLRPTVPDMVETYRLMRETVEAVRQSAGAKTLFEARVFDDLCFVASALSKRVSTTR